MKRPSLLGVQKHVPPRFSENYRYEVTGVDRPDPLPNPARSLAGKGAVLMRTLHVTADRFLGRRVNGNFMKAAGLVRSRMELPGDRAEFYALVDLFYGRCVRTLFPPSRRVRKLLQRFEPMLGNGIRVGVHLRMGQGHSDWTDSRPFLTEKRVVQGMAMIADFIARQQKKHKNVPVKIFLSTDSSEMEYRLRQAFPGMVVTTKGFQRSHVGGVRATHYNDDSIMKAVLDVMLLGKCDVLYLTTRSGFSKIGLYYAEENTPFRLLFSVCHKHAFCAIWRNCLILCLEWMTIISNSKMRCALSRPSMLRTS